MKKNSIVTSSFLNVNIVRASFKNKYLLWIWYKPNTCETLLTLRVIRYGFVYFWIVKRNRTRSRNVHILRSSHYRIVNPFDYTSTHVAYVMYSRCQFTPKQTVCKWQFLYSVRNSISCTNERVLYQFLIVFILPFITNTRTIRKLNQPGSFGVWFDLYFTHCEIQWIIVLWVVNIINCTILGNCLYIDNLRSFFAVVSKIHGLWMNYHEPKYVNRTESFWIGEGVLIWFVEYVSNIFHLPERTIPLWRKPFWLFHRLDFNQCVTQKYFKPNR